MKKNEGITLIALVITIVVLIILASVAITLSLGNNGVFKKAAKAKEDTLVAQNEESMQIAQTTNSIDEIVGETRGTTDNTTSPVQYTLLGRTNAGATNTNVTLVDSINNYRYVLVNYSEGFTSIMPIQMFRDVGMLRASTNSNYGSTQYVSDTVCTLYKSDTNAAVYVELYGIK